MLKEVQYVLRAIGRSHCKEAMIGVLYGAAATSSFAGVLAN